MKGWGISQTFYENHFLIKTKNIFYDYINISFIFERSQILKYTIFEFLKYECLAFFLLIIIHHNVCVRVCESVYRKFVYNNIF